MNNNIILIMYDGEIPEPTIVQKIANFLFNNEIASEESTTIKVADGNDVPILLYEALGNAFKHNINFVEKENPVNPVTEACIYISERYKKELSNDFLLEFALKLNKEFQEAKAKRKEGKHLSKHEIALLNAVQIIAEKCNEISSYTFLIKKYRIDENVVAVIKEIYNL